MYHRAALGLPLSILILLLVSLQAFAATRGIRVTDKTGTPLYLYKDYYALVIGVGDYTNGWPDLPGAEQDAREVAGALKEFGFTVTTLMNPDSGQLKKALRETAFRTGAEDNRAILFYFAGHGETLALADGTNLGYIIPTDCPLKDRDPLGFDDRAVSMKELEALALKVRSKHLLMVFDSCFSGSLFNLVRAAPAEISEKSAKPVRQFITAGSAGEQVPDRSVFKTVFLDGIRGEADMNGDGYVTGSELGMAIQGKVVNYSGGGQHPQYGKINNPKLDKGDFIFVPRNAPAGASQEVGDFRQPGTEAAVLKEERRRLEEERRKTEALLERLNKARQEGMPQDQNRLAYAPKVAPAPKPQKVTLRTAPKVLSERELIDILRKYGFFVMSKNPSGNFQNDFVDNKDGTVTDRATGLMWEKKGSSQVVRYRQAENYVEERNKNRFAGHSDWRIPTLEELCTLIEPAKNSLGYYIDGLFETKKAEYWSADISRVDPDWTLQHTVLFSQGDVRESRSVTAWQQFRPLQDCYILAVRTVKK